MVPSIRAFLTTRTLLGAPGIATRNKDATSFWWQLLGLEVDCQKGSTTLMVYGLWLTHASLRSQAIPWLYGPRHRSAREATPTCKSIHLRWSGSCQVQIYPRVVYISVYILITNNYVLICVI